MKINIYGDVKIKIEHLPLQRVRELSRHDLEHIVTMWTPVSSTWSDGFGMVLPVLLALVLVPLLQTGTCGAHLKDM